MIYLYALAAGILFLNILGRYLILRRDDKMDSHWVLPLKLCPGADVLYCIFRWEKARLGCVVCALSLVAAVPVTHQFMVKLSLGNFASYIAPGTVTAAPQTAAASSVAPAELQKSVQLKEKKVAELSQYLQQWFQALSERQASLSAQTPQETVEFNRATAAYKDLLAVWKQETEELAQLRTR